MKIDSKPFINESFVKENQEAQDIHIRCTFDRLFGTFQEKDVGLVLDVTAKEITDHYVKLVQEDNDFLLSKTKDSIEFLEKHPDQQAAYDNAFGHTLFERVYSDILWLHRKDLETKMITWTLSHATVALNPPTMQSLIRTYLTISNEQKLYKHDMSDMLGVVPPGPTDS